jgi:hypothetical protein
LESENGKIRLFLRSKKVARIAEFGGVTSSPDSLLAWHGPSFPSQIRRVIVYDYVFDDKQTKALDEARSLAKRTGLTLQVTDLSRQNALERALRSSLGAVGGTIARLRPDLKATRGPRSPASEKMVRQQVCQP